MKTFEDYGIHIDPNMPNQQRAICPVCAPERKERHRHEKDLVVNVEKGVWFCHHCGWTGGLEKGSQKYDVAPVKQINAMNTGWLYSYFRDRGISKQTVEMFRIKEHIQKRGMEYIREIAFPFYFGDVLYNYKYRTEDKHFRQNTGVEFSSFFNINVASVNNEVIITEGEIDVMSFAEAGLDNAISVPNGAPAIDSVNFHKEFKYIDDSADILKEVDVYYLAVDADKPGLRLREELARRLGKRKCSIVKYPEDCKDANDVLVKYGKEELRNCIRNASPYPIEGVFATKDFRKDVEKIYEDGYPNGVKTGWPEMDELVTFFPGQLSVVTGIPNSGKSPFIDNLMMNMAELAGWRFAAFSPENGAISNHIIRLIRQRVRKNFFPGYNNRCTKDEMYDAMGFINEHFYFVNPENEQYTIDKILEGYEYLVIKYGVRFVLLDPWNTLEHQRPRDESATDYVGRILNKFKYFARDVGVHFMLVAHPKVPEQYRLNYIPNMYSISGSANWYNVPDVGLIVHRHMGSDRKTTEYNQVIVEKVKFDWVGHRGTVKFDFDVAAQRFLEQERGGEYNYNYEPF